MVGKALPQMIRLMTNIYTLSQKLLNCIMKYVWLDDNVVFPQLLLNAKIIEHTENNSYWGDGKGKTCWTKY